MPSFSTSSCKIICIERLPNSCSGQTAAGRSHARGKRQQSNVARALDGFAQPALVARARAGHAPRKNLAAVLHEGLEHFHLLEVNKVHTVHAEPADLLFAEELPLALARAARPALSALPARPAFAARRSGRRPALRSLFFSHRCSLSSKKFLSQFGDTSAANPAPQPARPGALRLPLACEDAGPPCARACAGTSAGVSALRRGARSGT